MAMDTKDWIELAKLTQARVQNRREYEWKLAFGFWGLIAAFTTSVFSVEGFTADGLILWFLPTVYFIVWVITIWFWQWPLHSAYAGDHAWYLYYMNKAQEVKANGGKEPHAPGEKVKWTSNNRLWFCGQILFTLVLLFLSWFAIIFIRPMKAKKPDNPTKEPTKALSLLHKFC